MMSNSTLSHGLTIPLVTSLMRKNFLIRMLYTDVYRYVVSLRLYVNPVQLIPMLLTFYICVCTYIFYIYISTT